MLEPPTASNLGFYLSLDLLRIFGDHSLDLGRLVVLGRVYIRTIGVYLYKDLNSEYRKDGCLLIRVILWDRITLIPRMYHRGYSAPDTTLTYYFRGECKNIRDHDRGLLASTLYLGMTTITRGLSSFGVLYIRSIGASFRNYRD